MKYDLIIIFEDGEKLKAVSGLSQLDACKGFEALNAAYQAHGWNCVCVMEKSAQ